MTNIITYNKNILIWDIEKIPPRTESTTILWSKNSEEKNFISIVKYVEDNSNELRSIYLEWIYDLGEYILDGKKVIEHLKIRNNLSYWWMSSIPQKVNIDKSQNINESIKLLGLEKFINLNQPKKIEIHSQNRNLIRIVENLCLNKGISFSKAGKKSGISINGISPSIIAIIYLFWYFVISIPVIIVKNRKYEKNDNNIILIDIFTHIYGSSYKDYHFKSYYWEDLVSKLKEWNIKTNWLHIYYKNLKNKSFMRVRNLCDFFSLNSSGTQNHNLLESYLSLKIFYCVCKDYLKIRFKINLISKLKEVKPKGSCLDLWIIHSSALNESLSGKSLIKNCLYINLFEKYFANVPRQKIGIYISENQPWELALIYAWKLAKHGVLIATPHNTLRYWDLRHHFYIETYNDENSAYYPMPNLVAVNSATAMKNLLESGYPRNMLAQVEALRYLYLSQVEPLIREINNLTVLICADYQKNNTIQILEWLLEINKYLPENTKIIFRHHPIYKCNISKYKQLNLCISSNQLIDDFAIADVVITGLISSVAADAYTFGLSVIQILDGSVLNMSPLRSADEVTFVRSKTEMLMILNKIKQREMKPKKFFNLNKNLLLWKRLIVNSSEN